MFKRQSFKKCLSLVLSEQLFQLDGPFRPGPTAASLWDDTDQHVCGIIKTFLTTLDTYLYLKPFIFPNPGQSPYFPEAT